MRRFHALGADRRCSLCGRRLSDAEWERLPCIGYMVFPPFEDDPGEVLEMRNDSCGTTLSKPMPFTARQLEVGARHELEHTRDYKMAEQIAMDHLRETPDYYERLSKVGL